MNQNQVAAFNNFCTYLLRYDNNNFSKMSAGELAGFKRGNHRNDFELVKQKAKYNDITLANLSMVLYAIYMELDVLEVKDDPFKLLNILINNNPSFGNKGKLGNIPIQNLKELYQKVINQNNQLEDIIPETPLISNNNNTENQQQSEINKTLIEKSLKIIKALYKRVHLKQISIKVFQFHIQNGTVPEKLNIHHFPPPFLSHDIIFVDEHNKLVKECQNKMMQACMKRINEQISKIKDNINSNKNKIKDIVEDLDEKLTQISDEAENNLKPSLEKALDKARRITIREFVVKTSENDENISVDENWFVNDSNHHKSNLDRNENRPNETRSRGSSNTSRFHNPSDGYRSRNSSTHSRNNFNRSRLNNWNHNYHRENDSNRRRRFNPNNFNNSGNWSRNYNNNNNIDNNNSNWRNSNFDNNNWRNYNRSSSSNRNPRNYSSFGQSDSRNNNNSRHNSRYRGNNQ